ncbi:MAG: flagellar hook-associated protein FlgL [Planctomycetota bacterium]
MNFRITSSTFTNRAIHFTAIHGANVSKYQNQIASGVKFQRPSEEPIAFRQVTALRTRFAELQADRKSINQATSVLNTSVVQIQEFSDLVTTAKSLALQGVQTFDSDQRNALALEVEGLLERLKSVSVATFNGRYLYGGTQSSQPPFEFSDPANDGGSIVVDYVGSSRRSRAIVGDSIAVDTYYDGSEVFGSAGRRETVILGSTGAQIGPGTDTLSGRTNLLVTNDTTTFLGASGVQSGTGAADGDTVIGQVGQHSLEIIDTAGDGSAGTIRLNGGTEIAFTNTDTNLRLEGPEGEVVYVDTTAITAGFSGTVDIDATGSLSVDGGATSIAIDFSVSQSVVHSTFGTAVSIDSTGISKAGTDFLEFSGTSNAFQVLDELASDLRNERNLSTPELSNALTRRIADLEGLATNAFDTLAEQSSSLATLDSLGFRADDLMNSIQINVSELQATDIPEAALRFNNSQSLLEYTYAVTAQLSSLSLLNFLR